MTRILVIIATPERRGAEQFAVDLASKLSGTVTVRALGPTSTGAPLPVDVLGPSRFAPTTLRALRKLAVRHDVIVCHGGATLIPGAAAACSVGTPFVYRSVGDPAAWTDVTMAGLRVGQPLKGAAAVVALFPAARHTLIERYGLDPDRVVVLPNAVDPDRVDRGPATPRDLQSTLGLQTAAVTKWVGYVGALSEEKRVHLAVEAVASRPDWGLLIAGDGPEEQWLKSLAAYLAPERIHFLGRRSEVAEVYDLIDALVLPSRTEGAPAVAIEAALHGVPVVATNVGGVADAMAKGIEGVLVDNASVEGLTEALASALDGPQVTAPSANLRAKLLEHYDIAGAALAWDRLMAQAAALPAASRP